MLTPARRARSAGSRTTLVARLALALALAACARASQGIYAPTESPARAQGWADSILATLSPRDRAAQLVWPQVFGDFSPVGTPGWERVRQLIADEHVGGFVMSIGSPVETATKINAMQRLSAVPLIFGADYEAGAGFR